MTVVPRGRRAIAMAFGVVVVVAAIILLVGNRDQRPDESPVSSSPTSEAPTTVTEPTEVPITAPSSIAPSTTTAALTATTARPQRALPGTVKLLALGDSITADAGWRQSLYQQLTAKTGHKWSFVGSQNDGGVSGRHEGHSGWVNEQLADQAKGWVSRTNPDIVLIHGGTNDIWTGSSGSDAADELSNAISNVFAGRPDTHVIVAGIVPLFTDDTTSALADYEARIPLVVRRFANQGRSIQYVDMSKLLVQSDTRDGIHPNDSGKVKVANAWFGAVNKYVASK